MKFTVRAGMHLHHRRVIKSIDPKKPDQITEQHFPEGETIELDAEGAKLHAHRIEGADPESVAFLETLVTPTVQNQPITAESLAAALAALGMVAVPANRKAA